MVGKSAKARQIVGQSVASKSATADSQSNGIQKRDAGPIKARQPKARQHEARQIDQAQVSGGQRGRWPGCGFGWCWFGVGRFGWCRFGWLAFKPGRLGPVARSKGREDSGQWQRVGETIKRAYKPPLSVLAMGVAGQQKTRHGGRVWWGLGGVGQAVALSNSSGISTSSPSFDAT